MVSRLWLLKDYVPGSTYLEVIGVVSNERTIKMLGYVNLGDDVGESIPCLVLQYKLTFVLRHEPGQQCC